MNENDLPNYQLLDCGNFKKVENIAGVKIVRPAASAIWSARQPNEWKDIDLEFIRNDKGGGEWKSLSKKTFKSIPLRCGSLSMHLRPTPFGHLGLFAEQMEYWQKIIKSCQASHLKSIKVLNLFAYTGGSTIASALGGAEVVHVDASKTSVECAREKHDNR